MATVKMKFNGKKPSTMAYEIGTKAKKAVLEQIKVAALEHFDDNFNDQGYEIDFWQSACNQLTIKNIEIKVAT